MILRLCMQHRGLKLYKVFKNGDIRGLLPIIICSNYDPGVTLTNFTARSILETGFSIGKSENSRFSETIEACDLKVGRYRQLIDFIKVYEY